MMAESEKQCWKILEDENPKFRLPGLLGWYKESFYFLP
jgi:hypothetical protein